VPLSAGNLILLFLGAFVAHEKNGYRIPAPATFRAGFHCSRRRFRKQRSGGLQAEAAHIPASFS
jgi:hypothetical protein